MQTITMYTSDVGDLELSYLDEHGDYVSIEGASLEKLAAIAADLQTSTKLLQVLSENYSILREALHTDLVAIWKQATDQ